jgi:hypothetical protein
MILREHKGKQLVLFLLLNDQENTSRVQHLCNTMVMLIASGLAAC